MNLFYKFNDTSYDFVWDMKQPIEDCIKSSLIDKGFNFGPKCVANVLDDCSCPMPGEEYEIELLECIEDASLETAKRHPKRIKSLNIWAASFISDDDLAKFVNLAKLDLKYNKEVTDDGICNLNKLVYLKKNRNITVNGTRHLIKCKVKK